MTTSTLSEQEFRVKSDAALEQARRQLLPLADVEGFEIDLQDGVLELEFDRPKATKFVASPNAPARQIWVSAMGAGYKLSWSPAANAFALNGESLSQMLERLTRTFLGEST
jgi:iron donor protein CyaY